MTKGSIPGGNGEKKSFMSFARESKWVQSLNELPEQNQLHFSPFQIPGQEHSLLTYK